MKEELMIALAPTEGGTNAQLTPHGGGPNGVAHDQPHPQ